MKNNDILKFIFAEDKKELKDLLNEIVMRISQYLNLKMARELSKTSHRFVKIPKEEIVKQSIIAIRLVVQKLRKEKFVQEQLDGEDVLINFQDYDRMVAFFELQKKKIYIVLK